MTDADFTALSAALRHLADSIAAAKRPAYTQGSADVLRNFKESASRVGITPLQAWGVHFEKHVSAVMSRVQSGEIPQGEPINQRFADLMNYLPLGLALIEEEAAANPPQK